MVLEKNGHLSKRIKIRFLPTQRIHSRSLKPLKENLRKYFTLQGKEEFPKCEPVSKKSKGTDQLDHIKI